MKLKLLLLPTILLCTLSAAAQTDPLNAAYKPSIDCTPADYPSNVSLTGALAKLRQTQDTPTSITSYGSTPLPCYTFYATQNEIRSFQVHYHDSGSGTPNYDVVVSNFVKSTGPGGVYTISASSTDIVEYREWYATIRVPDSLGGAYLGQQPFATNTSATGTSGNLYYCSSCNFSTDGTIAGTDWLWDSHCGSSGNGFSGSFLIQSIVSSTEVQLSTSPTCTSVSIGSGFKLFHPQYDPDALIPKVDPYYNQTTAAFPITVAANDNQSVWIDVHVPAAAPSGWYLGSVTLKTGSTTITTLPVLLGVWQWPAAYGGSMPSTATLQTIFAGIGYCTIGQAYGLALSTCPSSYGGSSSNVALNSSLDAAVEMLDNRITSDGVNNGFIEPATGSYATFNSTFGPLLNGTASHVTGILSGAALTAFAIGNSIPGDMWSPSDASILDFTANAQTNGWFSKVYAYVCDEPPSGCSWSTVSSRNTSLHTNTTYYEPPIIPALVTGNISNFTANGVASGTAGVDLMTTTINDLEGTTVGNQRPAYTTWLTGNCCGAGSPTRKLGVYNDCLSAPCGGLTGYSPTSFPNRFVDSVPIGNQVQQTTDFADTVGLELYFAQDSVSSYVSGSDPFNTPNYGGVWGDGQLLDPCGTSQSAEGCGSLSTAIWAPTIRLKLNRDGMEDYEYYYLLANQEGKSATVNAQIATWYLNAYCWNPSVTSGSTVSWTGQVNSQNCTQTFTGDYTDARNTLGAAMQALTYGSGTPPAPSKLIFSVAQQLKDFLEGK
jgi:hypothetical protein